jgi:hypothetical protein
LQGAVDAGCIQPLLWLLPHGADSNGAGAGAAAALAATVLAKIAGGWLVPADGVVTDAKIEKGAFVTTEGIRWGTLTEEPYLGAGDFNCTWLDDGSESDLMQPNDL